MTLSATASNADARAGLVPSIHPRQWRRRRLGVNPGEAGGIIMGRGQGNVLDVVSLGITGSSVPTDDR